MHQQPKKIVSIVYRFLPQYRVDFYSELRERLREKNILLNVYYGKNKNVPKRDEVDLDWGRPIKNWTLRLGRQEFYLHPIPASLWPSDLLILAQENRMLTNYILWACALMQGRKIALWDHGINHQAAPGSIGNRFKRLYSTRASWWFAYTARVARIVADMGFPQERITVVANAIDTRALIREAEKFSEADILQIKAKLGITGGPVGIYCGGIYKEKRIDFLLEACRRIKKLAPGFEVVLIGAGPEAEKIKRFQAGRHWVHYLGPRFGGERVPYFKMAQGFLMPGAVGLSILDCFALETPMVTTPWAHHGPEIEYLIHGENGIVSGDSVEEFAAAFVKTVQEKETLKRLRMGCRKGAQQYTLENMVGNFGEGIEKALAS